MGAASLRSYLRPGQVDNPHTLERASPACVKGHNDGPTSTRRNQGRRLRLNHQWSAMVRRSRQWLATMGAEAIEIESQVYIDIGRINPSGMADRIAGPDRNGYYALSYDKKAITLSLATDKGRAAADILRKADYLFECFPTPAATKLGITNECVRAVQPDIVMVSVSLLGKSASNLRHGSDGADGMLLRRYAKFDAQGSFGRSTAQDGRHLARLSTSQSNRRRAVDRREQGGDRDWPDAEMVHGITRSMGAIDASAAIVTTR
jgi:hypothetical protein